jgi:tetratricopeptide (TPR) repeat protein
VEPPPPTAKVAIPSFLRNPGVGYPYADFGRPSAGDRAEAVRLLNDGINAHRSFKVDRALDLYRQAAEVDPSLFEAHYNRGVACFEAGELGESLRAYERALAVDPDSVPARFNFATTLQKSGYPADAVAQLDHLVKAHPEETRAHLALGNLYTDTFRDDSRAREHYVRVLQLDPQHPNATSLRFWLEAH